MKARLLLVLILPVLLAGCLLMPGQFGSSVDVKKDGSFAFAYKGEIVIQTGDRMFGDGANIPEPDENEKCWGPLGKDGKPLGAQAAAAIAAEEAGKAVEASAAGTPLPVSVDESRDCTKEELAERKKDRDEARAASLKRKKEEGEQFAQMTGFNPADEDAMKAFATQLAKQKGWKAVTYKGKGVFDVDYAISGTLDRDFLFPVFPRGNVMFPFVIIRKRGDGSVAVSAPTLVGGGMAAMAAMYGASGRPGRELASATRPRGTFSITTDGRFLTNNTEDGPTASAGGQTATWTVGMEGDKMPEALIKLN